MRMIFHARFIQEFTNFSVILDFLYVLLVWKL